MTGNKMFSYLDVDFVESALLEHEREHGDDEHEFVHFSIQYVKIDVN